MTKQELSKITQATLTNRTLAARIWVLRSYNRDALSEDDRLTLQLAAERLEILENPSINELHNYYKRKEAIFEPPIDNELREVYYE